MPPVNPWDFGTLVDNQGAQVQTAANARIDLSTGSSFRAWIEAQGGIGLFLQGLVIQAIALSLFATRYGPDADAWGAQFGFIRLPATSANGLVTFTRLTATAAAVLLVGTQAATGDNSQQFLVYEDDTNPLWSSSVGGYVVPIGVASVTVPVKAIGTGSDGNVIAGTISLIQSNNIVSQVPFDTVANPTDLIDGLDAESDSAYKARFPLFLAGLAKANYSAIAAAISSVQQGLNFFIVENQNVFGNQFSFTDDQTFADLPGTFSYPYLVQWPGMFFVVVDDGSGHPPQSLLTRISAAINAVRGLTIFYRVYAPVVMSPAIDFTLAVLAGFDPVVLKAEATTAVQNWLDSLPLGTPRVALTRIPQVIYDAVPGVANVTNVLINGVTQDLPLNLIQIAKAGTVTAHS